MYSHIRADADFNESCAQDGMYKHENARKYTVKVVETQNEAAQTDNAFWLTTIENETFFSDNDPLE